jgi:hypothetical protein
MLALEGVGEEGREGLGLLNGFAPAENWMIRMVRRNLMTG